MNADDTDNAVTQPPLDRTDGEVKVESFVPSSSVSVSDTVVYTIDSDEKVSRVSHASAYADEVKGSVALKPPNQDDVVGDASEEPLGGPPIASRSVPDDVGDVYVANAHPKTENKKLVGDYDSLLFEFDRFAYKGGGETVGYGYEIGDMVWGKVKSHPWWPGQILNELLASPDVRRTKREGSVLVAFFGDSSYGWFDPAELIPFAESYMEKSRQSTSRTFETAVEEAVDECSRRRSLGMACRCRNEFNFWPFSLEGYFTVYAGDYEPGVYSLSQINKAREEFRPKEMLFFVQQMALRPKTNNLTIEFFKNKAAVLACRKAFYEEYDGTYAQAFGSTPERPARPTAPVSVDPSKVSLTSRLVLAEDLGKGKLSLTPSQMKDELEKEQYLFKRRDEPVIMKAKKTSSHIAHPLPVDASGIFGKVSDYGMWGLPQQSYAVSGTNAFSTQLPREDAHTSFSEIRRRKLLASGMKNLKMPKKTAVATSDMSSLFIDKKMKRKKEASSPAQSPDPEAPRMALVKKMRKELRGAGSADYMKLSKSKSGTAVKQAPQILYGGPVSGSNNQVDNQLDVVTSLLTSHSQQGNEMRNPDLLLHLRDLRALALNPFHAIERHCPASSRRVFLKFRSIIYQKSLVSSPPAERETIESRLPSSAAVQNPANRSQEKSSVKLIRPPVRPNDPTTGGKRRILSDHMEVIKKRKVDGSKDVYPPKKRADLGGDLKKKVMNDSKLSAMKILHKSVVAQQRDLKDLPPKPLKSTKSDSSRSEKPAKVRCRTALMMKFPKGASLPSGAELAAKFARFGPLEFTATRIYWQTETCRLVFQHKVDAEAALKFAASSGNLFGYENVFCHLKDAATEGAETKTAMVQKEDTSKDTPLESRSARVQPVVPLKSILKKQPNDDGNGNGNGNGRGARVKFVLLGYGSPSTEQNSVTATTHSNSMDFTTKSVIPKLNPQSGVVGQLQTQKPSILVASTVPPEIRSSAAVADIAREFLSLLNRCSDVVNNVTGTLGYVPYHSL